MTDKQAPPNEAATRVVPKNTTSEEAGRRIPSSFDGEQIEVTNPDTVLRAFAQEVGLKYREELNPVDVDEEALQKLDETQIRQHSIIPVSFDEAQNSLSVATNDPMDIELQDTIAHITGCQVELIVARESDILRCIAHFFDSGEEALEEVVETQGVETRQGNESSEILSLTEKDPATAEMAVKVVNALLRSALQQGASDLSLEPQEHSVTIKLRRDGLWQEQEPPYRRANHSKIMSRLKILAGCKIEERNIPQDGAFSVTYRNVRYDIRLAILPGIHGSIITLRILDSRSALCTLQDTGLSSGNQSIVRNLVARSSGLLLVVGPTGSGKTTTLQACLNLINEPGRKIITIEDPVEYRIGGINHVQVQDRPGMSFADILRATLRQSPNVVLIGEMRDTETATVAMDAAVTGHLVFSTLHTRSAVGTVARLVSMGVAPYKITAALQAVVAQRLVRKLCPSCSYQVEPTEAILEAFGVKSISALRRSRGCERCRDGYLGRLGIQEVLLVSSELRQAVHKQVPEEVLRQIAQTGGFESMQEDGLQKAVQGIISAEEVLAATQ